MRLKYDAPNYDQSYLSQYWSPDKVPSRTSHLFNLPNNSLSWRGAKISIFRDPMVNSCQTYSMLKNSREIYFSLHANVFFSIRVCLRIWWFLCPLTRIYVSPQFGKITKPILGLPDLEWHSFPARTNLEIPKNRFGVPDLSAAPIWGLKRIFPNWKDLQTDSG
jgi:hypothetical protein